LQGSRRGKTLGEFLLSTASDLYLGSEKTRSARSYWRAYFCERDEKTKKPIRWATGVVDDGSRRSHTEAHRATVAWLASGGSRGPSMAAKNTVITTNVDEIGADFWVWDKSPYLAMVLSHDPHAVCREHVVNMEACYRNHVRPVLVVILLVQPVEGKNQGGPRSGISPGSLLPKIGSDVLSQVHRNGKACALPVCPIFRSNLKAVSLQYPSHDRKTESEPLLS